MIRSGQSYGSGFELLSEAATNLQCRGGMIWITIPKPSEKNSIIPIELMGSLMRCRVGTRVQAITVDGHTSSRKKWRRNLGPATVSLEAK